MGNGTVSKIAMAQLGSLMHDNWATGAVDAEFSLTMSGVTAAKLRSTAGGTADFTWNNGVLRHVSLDSHGTPVAFSRFAGKLALQDGTFTLSDGKMQSARATYNMKGTALYDRTVKIEMERSGGPSYVVSGTLDQPTVKAVTATSAEASLR